MTPAATTLFVGLYDATPTGTALFDRIDPLSGKTEAALGSFDPTSMPYNRSKRFQAISVG